MMRRIEKIQSVDRRDTSDFKVLSRGDDTSDFSLIPEDETTRAIKQEIRESSITPTTFVSREFQNNFDDQWYIEQYAYKSNNVVRFGINHLSDQVFLSLSSESVPLFYATAHAASTARSSSKYTPDDANQIALSELETLLLKEACAYLLATADTKTVLVDILVRVNGGANNGYVKLNNNKTPETHTVVLYKNPVMSEALIEVNLKSDWDNDEVSLVPREITVIDPSNFIFSSHLSNYNNLSATVHEGEIPFTINTIHKAIQIYQPVTKDIGSAPNQSRDCTDVAVKLALGLNQTNTTLQLLTYEDIKTCQIIQNLSNNSLIDLSIITKDLNIRAKQTSDITTVELFNVLERTIGQNHLLIGSSSTDTFTELRKDILHIMAQPDVQILLKNLCTHNANCVSIIFDVYQKASDLQMNLAGQIAHLDMEDLI